MFIKVFLLSLVEGLTEFLPVSSTGHMIILDHFLKLSQNKNFTNAFEIIIQLGAIIAVVIYFWDRLWIINKQKKLDYQKIKLWTKIIVAVLPAVVLGLLFDDIIEEKFFNPLTVSLMLVFYGIILLLVELYFKKHKKNLITDSNALTYRLVFFIGFFQTLAMIPGTSRSAVTIIGGMLLGLSRALAAEFSFFLAIPTMMGATLLKTIKSVHHLQLSEWLYIGLGFVLSFIFAYLVIKWFMTFIKSHDFKIFAWYRIVLGLFLLFFFYLK